MDIYRQIILDHYHNPQNFGEIKDPDASSVKHNPTCGDIVNITLKLKTEKNKDSSIEDIRFSGNGCAISQAAASLLTEHVKHMSVADVLQMTADDMLKMLQTTLTPARVKCATISLEALHTALHRSV